jgi:hypothetical protein
VFAIRIKDAGHAKLLCNQTGTHFLVLTFLFFKPDATRSFPGSAVVILRA